MNLHIMSITIAPWLQLPNFIGAAEAGGRIGLSRAQLAQEGQLRGAELAQRAAEAAARLGLGRDELAANERIRQAQIAAGKETAASRLAQTNALNLQKLGLSKERIDNLEQNRALVDALHRDQLNLAREKAEGATKSAADRIAQAEKTQQEITDRLKQQIAAREAAKIPTMDLTIPGTRQVINKESHLIGPDTFTTNTIPGGDVQKLHNVRVDDPLINQVLPPENAKYLGTNYNDAAISLLNPKSRTSSPINSGTNYTGAAMALLNPRPNISPLTLTPSAKPAASTTLQDVPQGPSSPTTHEEYDALEPGALYINPADGKQYRKKSPEPSTEE